MGRGPPRKSNTDFWDQNLEFFLSHGDELQPKGAITDRYDDHSVVKLVAMTYWAEIFVPIVRTKFVERRGYSMVYIDTMAGSGVTQTERKNDFIVGSCPAAWLASQRKQHPFDEIIGVEPHAKKAASLRARLTHLAPSANVRIMNEALASVAEDLHASFERKAKVFAFVDPEGFDGMTWEGLEPILTLSGDVMITWFERGCERMKQAALGRGQTALANGARMDDLFGSQAWRDVKNAQGLTDLFCRRIERDCDKLPVEQFSVDLRDRDHYKILLFAGQGCPGHLPPTWRTQMERRVRPGMDIATLIDLKKRRAKTLFDEYSSDGGAGEDRRRAA